MGKASGNPLPVSPSNQARLAELHRRNLEAMARQNAYQAPAWLQGLARPPDLYIAGQVFDGVTGELKRK